MRRKTGTSAKQISSATHEPILDLDLRSANVTSVIWCTGYGFDFDWVRLPILDDRGAPVQHRGVTSIPGAYFLGLHWMHKFKSGTLWGVGEDAQYLADHMRRGALRDGFQ